MDLKDHTGMCVMLSCYYYNAILWPLSSSMTIGIVLPLLNSYYLFFFFFLPVCSRCFPKCSNSILYPLCEIELIKLTLVPVFCLLFFFSIHHHYSLVRNLAEVCCWHCVCVCQVLLPCAARFSEAVMLHSVAAAVAVHRAEWDFA